MNHNLIITCCNDRGGIYRLRMTREGYPAISGPELINDMESRGIVDYQGCYYVVACGKTEEKRRGLHVFDRHWNHIKQFGGSADWHGLHVYDGRLYAVDAAACRINRFSSDLSEVDLELNLGTGMKLVNDIYITEWPNVYVSTFASGIVHFDAEKSKISPVFNSKIPAEQPHSVTLFDEKMWWCNSGKGNLMRHDEIILSLSPGYPRGLLRRINPHTNMIEMFVGVSSRRHDDPDGNAKLLYETLHSSGFVNFPSPEIYQIIEELRHDAA